MFDNTHMVDIILLVKCVRLGLVVRIQLVQWGEYAVFQRLKARVTH